MTRKCKRTKKRSKRRMSSSKKNRSTKKSRHPKCKTSKSYCIRKSNMTY